MAEKKKEKKKKAANSAPVSAILITARYLTSELFPERAALHERSSSCEVFFSFLFFLFFFFFYKIWHTWSPFNHFVHKEKEASAWREDELWDASFNVLFCYRSPSAVAFADHWGKQAFNILLPLHIVLVELNKLNIISPVLHVSRRFCIISRIGAIITAQNYLLLMPELLFFSPTSLSNGPQFTWRAGLPVSSRDLRVTHPQQVATLLRHMDT